MKKRLFRSGLREYYNGSNYSQFLNPNEDPALNNDSRFITNSSVAPSNSVDNNNMDTPSQLNKQAIDTKPISSTNIVEQPTVADNVDVNSLGQMAFRSAPQKGIEGKALAATGTTALAASSLASSGALGSGALAAGVGAAALPVAIGAGALLAINQGAKAIAGEQDEFGVYKNDRKARWGGLGNIADTMGKAKDLKDNKEQYAYLTGDSESSIKATGRLGRIPVFGTVNIGGDINKVKREARDRALDLMDQQSKAEESLEFSDTIEGNRSKYGTTYANGGQLNNSTNVFTAKGSTHENGGVSIGDNKEIEKGEIVYKGYVFSNRLPYKK